MKRRRNKQRGYRGRWRGGKTNRGVTKGDREEETKVQGKAGVKERRRHKRREERGDGEEEKQAEGQQRMTERRRNKGSGNRRRWQELWCKLWFTLTVC